MKRAACWKVLNPKIAACVAVGFATAFAQGADDNGWRPTGEAVTTVKRVPLNPANPGAEPGVTSVEIEYVPKSVRYLAPAIDRGLPSVDSAATGSPAQRTVRRQTFASEQTEETEPERITAHKPVWVERLAEEVITVRKPVIETGEKIERRTVRKPVVETTEREESYTVLKPVYETTEREERTTVCRPVFQPSEIDQTVTAYQPTVTYQTYYAGFGQWVTAPVTSYVPTQVVQRVPTETVQYVESQEVRKAPVQTMRYVEERQTRKVPVETCRWVEEQTVKRIPVERVQYVEERIVRKIPITP